MSDLRTAYRNALHYEMLSDDDLEAIHDAADLIEQQAARIAELEALLAVRAEEGG